MSEKKQFDKYLGGSEKLPRDAQVIKLATARASEMAAMTYSLENPQQTKLIFQKLPVHMRRRIMSHNAKRMPRKLRNSHLSQMKKSGLPPKTKRPSRKYRRRPQNLLLEYNKRQRDKFWLETHIWHAKRFKMIEKWGFKLAYHSNDRCFRANYRAVTNHCLIQDISYYTCIEIKGPLDILKEKLKMHCNPNELTFGAKVYINGEREGTLMFYKKNGYPYHPVGHVHFLWKPNDNSTKAIWIWVHPAFYNEILKEIITNFNFEASDDNNFNAEKENNQDKMKKNDQNKTTSELRIFLTAKIPIYYNTDGCQLLILRNSLNRFRLCGPLALSIVCDAFKLPNINFNSNSDKMDRVLTEADEDSLEKNNFEDKNLWQMDLEKHDKSQQLTDAWFKKFYQLQDNSEIFKIQRDVYNSIKNLKSPNQLPPNMVLALTILDPRFFLPNKRTKSVSNPLISEKTLMPPTLANRSPLWDLNIRNYVTKSCTSATAINNLRSQNLVPGVQNDQFYNEDIMHKIPILLIQKSGNYAHNNSIGFGSGIDIVLPAGWSVPLWLSLILRCAKPGGLRESKSIAYENSNFNLPSINYPDTNAYIIEADYEKKKLTEKYFRLPPNKRVNYIKYGITSPFFCEWKLLIHEWTNADSFYILKDRRILTALNAKMHSNLEKKRKIAHKAVDEMNLSTDIDHLIENKNCFVPVKVTIQRRGLPKDFSLICIPTKEDLEKYSLDKKWSGPIESLKSDSNEEKRKTLRRGHLALLKRLRRQRIRAKKKMENAGCNLPIKNSSQIKHFDKIRQLIKKKLINSNKTLIDEQAETMANLYLPKCTNVKNSCDREVIGYVTQGGFSYSEAKGVGLGYVVLSSILNLIKKESNIILTRNTTTRKYRICKIEILN